MGFTAAQVAKLQAAALSFMDATCTTLEPDLTQNSAGAATIGFTQVATNVKCHVRPMAKSQVLNESGQSVPSKFFQVILPVGTQIAVNYRIISGAYTYEVKGHDAGKAYPVKIICDCERVNDGAA